MAKTKTKNIRFVWFLGVAALIIVGFLVYQYISTQLNKRDFQQARAAIDTIYADIVARVGQPDNSKRTNDCSRPSEEFTQGPLSCSVGTDFIYGVDNEQQANQLFKQIQAIIAAHPELFKSTKPLSSSITDTLVVNTYYHSAEDYYSRGGNMDCFNKYIYDTPREIDLSVINPSQKPLQINIDCSDWAKAQYYPLE
jgi:hypothetical protein